MLSRKYYQDMNRDWPGKWALPIKDLPPDLLQGIGYPLFERSGGGRPRDDGDGMSQSKSNSRQSLAYAIRLSLSMATSGR